MKNLKNRCGKQMRRNSAKYVAGASIMAVVTMFATAAGATGDVISDAFVTLQGTLLGYLGDAVVVIIALLGIGSGIYLLLRWILHVVVRS